MCGIIAGVAKRDLATTLLKGLKSLEYRGYDSAGLAVIDEKGALVCKKVCGKVDALLKEPPPLGKIGIAHTRWATHGQPSVLNAHPQLADDVALVHNGIIENYQSLKNQLNVINLKSQTDTEVVVNCIAQRFSDSLCTAMQKTVVELKGNYALVVMAKAKPDSLVVACSGSPLLIGVGEHEHFVASDSLALLPVAKHVVALECGDVAEIFYDHFVIYDKHNQVVTRVIKPLTLKVQSLDKGAYRHYMQKEIFEQPQAVARTIAGRVIANRLPDTVFGEKASGCFDKVRALHLVACGTSYHAGLVAGYWLEQWLGIPCHVEVASEFRYRRQVVAPDTLFVALSQSGETADTLAALRGLRSPHYCGKLVICNVAESALVREADLVLLTHAGPEVGVASTKAFTSQLTALLMLVHCLSQRTTTLNLIPMLNALPEAIAEVLTLEPVIAKLARCFFNKQQAIFVGRGVYYFIAKEGALKLKEISYIHAQAYPAGELKHGPLALVDKEMPVIALVAKDDLVDKLASNLQEICARQGELIVLAEKGVVLKGLKATVVNMPFLGPWLSPIGFNVLLQLLAYHVALLKGTDIDQPRNLAKSVTVE